MSEISRRIRKYVEDYEVADHYGDWGILRRDQRRLIRELCDMCDSCEAAADKYGRELIKLQEEDKRFRDEAKQIAITTVKEFAKALIDISEGGVIATAEIMLFCSEFIEKMEGA